MICVLLAAGYATRLYPLTENFPKPLLPVQGKPILDLLLEDIDASGLIDRYVLVSNHRYAPHFEKWAAKAKLSAPITVLDDGSTSNETRLGAVMDIQFAMDQLALDDDLFVLACDNVLDFSLTCLLDYAKYKGTACLFRYHEPDAARLHKCGVIQIDEDERILRMEEKPQEPFSHWCTPPFYVYPRETLPLIRRAIKGGCGTDAPGSLTAWMAAHTAVHAMEMPGARYDIGDLESYERVQQSYIGI